MQMRESQSQEYKPKGYKSGMICDDCVNKEGCEFLEHCKTVQADCRYCHKFKFCTTTDSWKWIYKAIQL